MGRVGEFGGTVKPFAYDPNKAVSTIQHAWEAARRRTQRYCPVCDGTLVDQEKPATGYICDAGRFEMASLPAGLIAIRFHDLRHTAISLMIGAPTPLIMLAKIVGWSASTTAKMATRYGHFSTEDLCARWIPLVPAKFLKLRWGTREIPRDQATMRKPISTKLLILMVGGQGLEPRTSCL